MRRILCIVCFLTTVSSFAQTKITVSNKDFAMASGAWTGKLTYLDYTSGKPFTMPANVTVNLSAENRSGVVLAFIYPKEPKANGNDTLFISADGMQINNATLVSKKTLTDGSIELITDKEGVDGNDHKKAILRHIYTIGKNNFSNRKEVKFDGTIEWILRNEYVFTR